MPFDRIGRAELMALANYDTPRFQSLQRRDQFPFNNWWKHQEEGRNGYPAFGAWLLGMGDLLVTNTNMRREEIAELSDVFMPGFLQGYIDTVDGKAGWMAIRHEWRNRHIRFGTKADLIAWLAEDGDFPDKLMCGTLIEVQTFADGIADRARKMGINVVGEAD